MANQTFRDVHIDKAVLTNSTLPKESVGDREVEEGAGIDPTKLIFRRVVTIGQKNGANNVAQRQGLSVVHGSTGALVACYARNITAATGSDSTIIQIKVNGADVLTAALTLNAAAGTATQSTTAFTSTALVAGDVIDVSITLSGTTVGQGVSVTLVFDELPE